MTKENKKWYVLESTEESGFETWVSEFETETDAIEHYEGLLEDYGVETDDNEYQGLSEEGYEIYLAVGTDLTDAIKECDELRERMINEMGE